MCVQECSFIQRVRYAILWWLAPYLSWLVSLHSRRTGIVRTVTSHSLSHSLSLCIYTTSFAALLSCNHHHHISTPNSPRNVLLPPPLSSENVYRLAPDERCINNPPMIHTDSRMSFVVSISNTRILQMLDWNLRGENTVFENKKYISIYKLNLDNAVTPTRMKVFFKLLTR